MTAPSPTASGPTPSDPPTILVLDYPGRRPEAAIADLELDRCGFAPTFLLRSPMPAETVGSRYARALLDRVDGAANVAAVLAYCLAAPLGHDLAAQLSADGRACPLVLFDAAPGRREAVVTACQGAIAQLGGEPTDAARELIALAGSEPEQPERLVDRMRDALRRLATEALLEDDEEPEDVAVTAAQLAGRHLEWLLHLMSAASATLPPWPGEVLHLVSRHHPVRSDWPGAASTRTVQIDCDRETLLRHADTRQAVVAWLDSQAPVTGR